MRVCIDVIHFLVKQVRWKCLYFIITGEALRYSVTTFTFGSLQGLCAFIVTASTTRIRFNAKVYVPHLLACGLMLLCHRIFMGGI